MVAPQSYGPAGFLYAGYDPSYQMMHQAQAQYMHGHNMAMLHQQMSPPLPLPQYNPFAGTPAPAMPHPQFTAAMAMYPQQQYNPADPYRPAYPPAGHDPSTLMQYQQFLLRKHKRK